ncbi:Cationic amino acid transporter 1 [Hondaea fermentalgiana]|uniref:Cationic amino acid transporter 1 n=1 Tax=Hondaea fermentalgiana TaxID=2315210 RepID=A0A2R5G3Y5_9STRA|nr:Cationic amino acid transporter 1 [Hondaea fermentalgiana]|eukprot:GBG25265.1 Cationic amino acid transporter 1 [Hondaea fermentalgiana]
MATRLLRRKPLWLIKQQAEDQAPSTLRVYDFVSLLAVGVGGTIGSGIFVLAGTIAHAYAGPATCLSWLGAGLTCLVTALAYAELACRIPSAGSTYSFASHAAGEIFGVYGAFFLTLEYGLAGSAVARSWGDKVAYYASDLEVLGCRNDEQGIETCWINSLGGSGVNPGATLLCILMVSVLLGGVEMGRKALNVLVVFKILLVLFVIIVGALYFDPANISPFIPDPAPDANMVGGSHGIFLGSTIAFFGYIGFDEVACLVMEATDPHRDVPVAIIATIFIITVLYILASFVLVGMVPTASINADEGFGSAFAYVGADWAVHIIMIGQILVVLPAVVLVSFLPQSRLQATVAIDGMLPRIFAHKASNGNFVYGVILSGIFMTLTSTFVPFHNLNDLISGGILLSFILTNICLLFVRVQHRRQPMILIILFVIGTALTGFATVKAWGDTLSYAFGFATLVIFVVLALVICGLDIDDKVETFRVPLVPLIPCVAIQANWFLFAQLSSQGLVQVAVLLGAIAAAYILFALYSTTRGGDHVRLAGSEDEDVPPHSSSATVTGVTEIELT